MIIFCVLNDNTVDVESPDGVYSPTFVVDEFSELFLHPSVFFIKHSKCA